MLKYFSFVLIFFSTITTYAQTGYYRSVVAGSGVWSDLASWEYSVDNIAPYGAIGAEGYPGELGIPTSVLVRDGDAITLDVTPANSIGALSIGEGGSGSLVFGNDLTIRSLTVSNTVVIAVGGNLVANTNSLHTLSIGDDLTVNGTFDGQTIGTQAVNTTFTGNTSVISGSGSIEFNTVTFNHTGTTTVSADFTIQNSFEVSNTSTVNLGTQVISGAGASDTFTMTSGTIQIDGTNTFPSGFETITLSGGTVEYIGTNQTVAHQESDGGALIYNNIVFIENPSGAYTKTFGGNTDINGTVTIEANNQIDLGAFSHTLGGSWVQNGSIAYVAGNSTVTFDGNGFQQINNPINTDPIEFNNLMFNGGGVVSFNTNNNLYVYGNFEVDNNTTLSTAANVYIDGDYLVNAGSIYNQTAGILEFNGVGAQAINLSNTSLIYVYFDNGTPALKTISGDANVSNLFYVYTDAAVTDAAPGQNHTFASLRVDGSVNFQGSVTTTGYLSDNDNQAFDLGSADLTVNGGYINTNVAMTMSGNFTVNSGTFSINSGASITGAGNALTVLNAATLNIAAADGFPTGFASNTLGTTSRVRYYLNGAQVVRGNLDYGELELAGGGVKTFDGDITVALYFDLNNGVIVNAGTFNHVFRDRIYNNTGSSFSSTGTGSVTIYASDGANYSIIEAGTYTFNNLTIDTDTQTGNYIYDINSNLTVNGNFTLLNNGGDATNQARFDLNTFTVQNDFGDVFSVGPNIILGNSGTTNLQTSLNTFASNSFDLASTVYYNGTGVNQTITNLINPYGNISFWGNASTKTPSAALNVDGDWTDAGGNYFVNYSTFTHTVAGDFVFDNANTTIGTSTIIFDGGDQTIREIGGAGTLLFNNVTFSGTGTKTLDDNFDINGNVVIDVDVVVDASSNDVDFYVARNWTNNGTFNQTSGEFYFDGTSGNQNIFMANGYFGAVDVNKAAGTRRVTMTSEITISRSLTVRVLNEFRTGNFDIYIGDDFLVEATSIWTQNAAATVYFNGTDLQQIRLLEPISFRNIVFQNSGTKRNENNPMDVNGNITIELGSTFNSQGYTITVSGDWTNNGSFLQTGAVNFDGTNQTINASSFNRILATNAGTKTLGGGVTITDDLIIDPGVTFDVSPSNYPLTIGDDFTVNGTFTARNGTITFNGNSGVFTTGGTTFYTLNVNKNAGQRLDLVGDLTLSSDLTITTGELRTATYDLNLSGSLSVVSGALLNVNNALADINFLATSGTHQIETNGSILRNVVVNAPGATYELTDNLALNTNHSFTLTTGTFDFNQQTMSLLGTGVVTVNGGTFDIDENAILKLPNNSSLTNNGGVIRVVGLAGNPARIERNGGVGGYTITQNSGTFHALYYEFFNTITNGITLSGGSIDATNNFSSGSFNSGTGNQYLNLTGLTIVGITADNVTFGVGPTYNVTRTAGSGTITFEDASGNLAGAAYENDGGVLIDWTFPGGVYWDAGAGSSLWSDDLNWSGNTKPDNSNNVILNHDFVIGAYTVEISAEDANANRVTLDAQGGAAIGLTITAGFDLTVVTNVQIGTTTTVTIDDGGSVLTLAENLDNSGTISHTAGLVRFNASTGSHSIRTGASSLYNLEIDANGATYTLVSALDVDNDITLLDGTLDISSNNYAITVGGNWSNIGLTTFNARSGNVSFDLGGNSAQTISGGPFYDLTTVNGTGIGTATKQLSGNVDVNRDVIISANTILDAQTNNLYVGRNWTNNASTGGFTQSGTGVVTFDGTGNQTIDNGAFATTFNDISFSSGGTITLANNSNVNGDVSVAFTAGTFNLSTFTLTGVGGANDFTVAGGSTLQLFANNFPTTFETLSLASNSTVQYRSNSNQDIYNTTYGNLTLLRNNPGNLQTKTALGDLTVLGNLTVNDVDTEFDLAGFKLTLTGGLSFPVGGRNIVWGGGIVEQNHPTDFNFDPDITEWPTLILSGSGTKDLGSNISITGDLTVQNSVNLRMFANTITANGGVQTFSVDNGGSLTCSIDDITGVAYPTNFDNYTMGSTSNTFLNSASDQTVFSGVSYGNLTISGGGTATIDGDLYVAGNYTNGGDTFADGGFDLYLSGADNQLNNYIASVGTTVTLDGTAQTLRETSSNLFTLRNIVFAGSGAKTLTDGNDVVNILGNFTVNPGVEVDINRNISIAGNFTNNGTFNQTANTLTFNGVGAQSIITNLTTTFFSLNFTTGGAKTFTTEGAVINGTINIAGGNTVNLGAFDYTLGYNGANFIIGGTLISSSANFTLTANNPDLPANLQVNNLTLNSAGDVDMTGNLVVLGNLNVNSQLDVNNAAYSLNVGGDFIVTGTFNDFNGSVTFDGAGGAVTVETNGGSFYDLNVNPSGVTVYTLTSPTNLIERAFTINNNATLDLNGNQLTVGSNIGAGKSGTINGTLEIDDNAVFVVDNNNSAYTLTVNGTLRVVGSSGNPATITSIYYNNTRRTALNITASGTIHARYYLIEYLDNNGLVLTNGATVDGTNNFSDGTFSNIVTAAGGPYYYLTTNSVAIAGTINNVNFGFVGTPTVGVHNNVSRTGSASVITFGGSISGSLGSETYESDPGSKIDWPVITTTTWTGNFDTNWHEPANWSSLTIPLITTDVTVPAKPNAPIISTDAAVCKNITISDGSLTLQAGFDLTVDGNLILGTGASAGTIIVSDPTSEISVAGSWTRGTNGIFTNGGSSVNFTAASGSVSITHSTITYPFNNVNFTGAANFQITGAIFDINGNLTISAGTFNPSTNNYTIYLAGNLVNSATMNNATNGVFLLDGGNQAITTANFDQLTVSGTLVKTFNGANQINDKLIINSTLSAALGSVLDMNGIVTIGASGTFNNVGGGTHTVAGATWTNSGTYSGTGTINFDGGNQTINTSSFAALELSGTGVKTLGGNLSLTGNLLLRTTFTRLNLDIYQITHTGAGTMTVEGNQTIYVLGANNFPTGFATYDLSATSNVEYRRTSAQTIKGGIAYGNLILQNANTKTLGGNITVLADLTFNASTLDVSPNNYSITIGDDWNNISTGSFIARLGDVIFNGSDGVDAQTIRSALTGTKTFYKLTINKDVGNVYVYDQNILITDNLTIAQGNFNVNGLTATIGGSFDNTGGSFNTSGTYIFTSTSGAEIIRSNGSTFNSVQINGTGTTFTCQDDFATNANFQLQAGTFNGNGNTVRLGNNVADIITIDGAFQVGANGTLALGNAVNFTVNASGSMYVVGAPGQPATVTRATTGSYAFQVNGTIHARYHLFEYMDANGIVINSSATIHATNNFSDGTFTNGTASGTFLRIENTQSLTIDNVNFPNNPGGTPSNITKVVAASGILTLTNASGVFAGEVYDDDPNNLINWPTPIVLTWNGGTSSNWYTAANWTASAGPSIVPTGAENVVIATATNQPIISVDGALASNLTINNGATLTMATTVDLVDDLVISGNLTLNGTLTASSANDSIKVAGSWLRGTSGLFNNGGGTVIFNGVAGSHNIDSDAIAFYNFTINSTSIYNLSSNLLVNNTLDITSGTLDVSATNYAISVGNQWQNTGTFTPRVGTVTFSRSTAGTANINNNASSFHNLIINGGASTTFSLLTNSMTVNGNFTLSNSTFSLNGLNLIMGDGTGSDIFNINGTVNVSANSQIRMGNTATIQVQSGGNILVVGTDASNVATVTRNTTGTYSFLVSGGATIQARYYLFEYMNANGIQIQSGATIHATNNFSDGTFSNGTAGGRYLEILSMTTNRTVSNIVFNSGPTNNVRGTSGTGNFITFQDASGLLAGPTYEVDDNNAATGAVRWTSTSTQYTWTGAISTNWNVLGNWNDGIGVPLVLPDATIDVIIPNVANDPIISAGNANANSLTIQVGGILVINTNRSLTLASNFTNGGTLTIPNGSASTISVGNNYSNSGTVNLGNSSTVELTAASGIKSLAFGGSSLNNLTLNGAATFNLTSNLDVNGSLTITNGTLDVTASNFTITVAKNWTNNGSFTARSGRVTFDGTVAQAISAGGSGATKRFYNFRISKSNTATLTSDIYVSNNVELVSGTLNLGSITLETPGTWNNTNVTVVPATSTVIFSGASSMTLTSNSQSFNHLTINKTGGNQVSLSSNTGVNGTLTITAGTLLLNGRRLDYGDGVDNTSIDGTLYVDAGSTIGMHQNASIVVNNGGLLRVTGTNASNVATITRRASTAGWQMTINGTLKAQYAVFEYSGGNGITIGASGVLDAVDNLSNSIFRNGTGTSYITNNANITHTIDGTTFNSGSPTYNVSSTNGSFYFTNYLGNFSGARYENDAGPTHPGFVRWKFNRSLAVTGVGTYNFNDEVVVQVTANSGLTNVEVDYRDQLYNNTYNAAYRYYRLIYTGGTATANLTFAYSTNELNTMTEGNLKIWVHNGGTVWERLATSSVNVGNKTVTINGYTIGSGTAESTIPKGAPKNDDEPNILAGSQDFFISDAVFESALPVELTRFEAKESISKTGNLVLEWETATETENYGFMVMKSYLGYASEPNKTSVPTDTVWTEVQFIKGKGNSVEKTIYTFEDIDVQAAGKYVYRLKQIDFDGEEVYYDPIEVLFAGPEKFELGQNYPNPFNPLTVIPYDVATRTHIRLDLFNILGQRVQTLVNEVRNPGSYKLNFNAANLGSGMYLIRYSAEGRIFIKKMLLVK